MEARGRVVSGFIPWSIGATAGLVLCSLLYAAQRWREKRRRLRVLSFFEHRAGIWFYSSDVSRALQLSPGATELTLAQLESRGRLEANGDAAYRLTGDEK